MRRINVLMMVLSVLIGLQAVTLSTVVASDTFPLARPGGSQNEVCICNDDYTVCTCCETVATFPYFACDLVINGEDATDDSELYLGFNGDRGVEVFTDLDLGGLAARTRELVDLSHGIKDGYFAHAREGLEKLQCHVTSGGWMKCDWPYAPHLCKQVGWVPHHDGSCCKKID